MNDVLVKATDLVGRPVVTLDGMQVGEVKDVVLGLGEATLIGFTLRNPGFFGGPMKETVPWRSIHAVGPDAVMIPSVDATGDPEAVDDSDAHAATEIPVVTDDGAEVGRVTDVVLATGCPPEVVGFEIEAGEKMPSSGSRVLLPIEAMRAASSEAVVVPPTATDFVHDDLSGFGAAVDRFRASLEGDER